MGANKRNQKKYNIKHYKLTKPKKQPQRNL